MFQIALYTKSFCISNKQNEIPHNIKLFIIYVFISIIPNVSDFFCSAARAALYCLPCLRSSWPRSRLQVWAWECRLTVTELCRVLANRRGVLRSRDPLSTNQSSPGELGDHAPHAAVAQHQPGEVLAQVPAAACNRRRSY